MPKFGREFLGEVAQFLTEIERGDLARGVEETARTLHGKADAGA